MKVNLTSFRKIVPAELEVLTGAADGENTFEKPKNVAPVKNSFRAGKSFEYTTEPMSLMIMQIKTK